MVCWLCFFFASWRIKAILLLVHSRLRIIRTIFLSRLNRLFARFCLFSLKSTFNIRLFVSASFQFPFQKHWLETVWKLVKSISFTLNIRIYWFDWEHWAFQSIHFSIIARFDNISDQIHFWCIQYNSIYLRIAFSHAAAFGFLFWKFSIYGKFKWHVINHIAIELNKEQHRERKKRHSHSRWVISIDTIISKINWAKAIGYIWIRFLESIRPFHKSLII